MRLFLKSIFLFILLLVVMSYPASYLISKRFHTYNKQNWILNKQELKLDYAVLGASRAFNMIDIASLDNSFEKKGINIGTSGSCYAENYIILSEFLSKNDISVLILNTDQFNFNSANSFSYPFHDYEFLPLFKKYADVFRDYIPAWKYYLWNSIPAAKYIEYNNQYTLRPVSGQAWNQTMGTELLFDKSENNNLLINKKRSSEINSIDEKYFYKILHLCSEKKISTILVTTPMYKSIKVDQHFKKYIDSVSTAKNLSYYSYEDLIDYTNNDYFKDETHTNALGSIEYSINLGNKLKNSNK